MVSSTGWMSDVAASLKQRQMEISGAVGGSLAGTFTPPPPPPPFPSLDEYMTAEPQERQAMLQQLPPEEFGPTMSRLQSEAVSRYGAMASKIQPIFDFDASMVQQEHAQFGQATGMDANLGVSAAHADLVAMLGMDPFAPQP